jgi:hypothetical protein
MRWLCIAALAWVGGFASAEAATPAELYIQGKYDAAKSAGIAQNDAAGFVVAARAGLALEMERQQPCLTCIRDVEALAQRAIAADPKMPEGLLYYAVALGYESRVIGQVAAVSKNYASEAKHHLDAALASAPDNGWVLAALGGWNIEIVRGGGPMLARWMYGANVEDGLADFTKAFHAMPDNLVLRYQYALSLSGLDLTTYRNEVEDALLRAATGKPQTAYEVFAQGRARELRDMLKKGDTSAYLALVKHDQGYP